MPDLSECTKDCVGGCGLGLTCPSESFYSPPLSSPYSDAFPVVCLATAGDLAGVGYTNVGACGEPGRHRMLENHDVCGALHSPPPHGLMARRRRPSTNTCPPAGGPAREEHTQARLSRAVEQDLHVNAPVSARPDGSRPYCIPKYGRLPGVSRHLRQRWILLPVGINVSVGSCAGGSTATMSLSTAQSGRTGSFRDNGAAAF